MHRAARTVLALCLAAPLARAQGLPGELALPGTSVASTQGADALRVNPGGIGVGRAWSLRATNVQPLGGAADALEGTAVGFAAPLPFGFGVAVGAQWHRPALPSPRTGPQWGSFDLGLAYAFTPRLTVGLQFRTVVTAPNPVGDLGTDTAMDLGALWRPNAHVALGLAARNVWGPRSPEGGIDTTFVGGAAVRPTGTDALDPRRRRRVGPAGELQARRRDEAGHPARGLPPRRGGVGVRHRRVARGRRARDARGARYSAGGGGFFRSDDAAGWYASAGSTATAGRCRSPRRAWR
jgi:hypothetical protein